MINQLQINNQTVHFSIQNDTIFTTSTDIAKVFKKRHDNIIAQIKSYPADNFTVLNFKDSDFLFL